MSKFAYRPCGGLEGIATTRAELRKFAKEIKKDYIDQFMPLPTMSTKEQIMVIDHCKADHDSPDILTYWEDNQGSHGWCCSQCGQVIQWG
jgi:hypothetical protein